MAAALIVEKGIWSSAVLFERRPKRPAGDWVARTV